MIYKIMLHKIAQQLGWIIIFLIAITLPALVMASIYQYQNTKRIEKELSVIKEQISIFEFERLELYNQNTERIEALEKLFHGDVIPELKQQKRTTITISPNERWLNLTLNELRKRVTYLEKQLLLAQDKKQE